MAVSDFLPFATGVTPNVTDQATYSASAIRSGGFVSGKAPSAFVNKTLRQGSFMAAVLGQFIANYSSQNQLDDGDVNGAVSRLLAAVTGVSSATSSGSFVQQGTGIGQSTNKVKIGWDGSTLRATVDTSDLGSFAFRTDLTTAVNNEATARISNVNSETAQRVTGDNNIIADYTNLLANKVPFSAFGFNSNKNGTINIAPQNAGGAFPMIQFGSGVTATGYNDIIGFSSGFPTACLQVVISEGSSSGWGTGADCRPTVYGTTPRDKLSFFLSGVVFSATGVPRFAAGITYNYIAIGY